LNREKQNRRKHRRLRHIAVVPSLVTLMNALCGFTAIHFAARGMNEPKEMWKEGLHLTFYAASAWMIVLAMIADAIDGFVARRAGSSSHFGGQLDSLSDAISFGLAPAFLMLRLVESHLQEAATPLMGTFWGRLLWLAGAFYVCCAILRLARFNVENAPDESAHLNFSGLPSPAAAGVIVALVLLYSDIGPELKDGIAPEVVQIGEPIIAYLLPPLTVVLALLMVSRAPYAHLINQLMRGRRPFEYLVILVILMLFLVWKLQLTLAVGSLAYASSGVIRWLWRKYKQKRKPPPETT
jgi:CDP-diacylglycerol--serine O-phosphatidyltransferase